MRARPLGGPGIRRLIQERAGEAEDLRDENLDLRRQVDERDATIARLEDQLRGERIKNGALINRINGLYNWVNTRFGI